MILAKNENKKMMVPAGTYNGICIWVADIGMQETQFGNKHNVVFGFELDCPIPEGEYEGKRFVRSKTCALSLHERASLSIMLQSWIGKNFSDEEREEGFNIEEMESQSCMVTIAHEERNGKMRDIISSVTSLAKGLDALVPENNNTPPQWVKDQAAKAIA